MRFSVCCVALVSASILSVSATAQTAAPTAAAATKIESGALLTTADGKRLGRISRVFADSANVPVAATIIVDERFVRIPASTLSAGTNGLVTSLTRAEVRKLN